MRSPFPGMDPYLEAHWGDVHTSLALYARDQLSPQLPGDLYARVEEYLAVEADDENAAPGYYPDVQLLEQHGNGAGGAPIPSSLSAVAVAEPVVVPLQAEPQTLRAIRIYDPSSGDRIVTAIEFLSPANKVGEPGRRAYRQKQQDFLDAGVSVVEIDLVREGSYLLIPSLRVLPPDRRGPYRISVVRGWQRFQAETYRVSLREPIPAFRVPLRPTDADVILNLQPLLDRCYENGRYGFNINYRVDPVPPLQGDDAAWADALLREKGLR